MGVDHTKLMELALVQAPGKLLSAAVVSYPRYKHIKGKGKAIPLQAWTGPEGSTSLRLLDFKTIGT